MHMGLPHPKCQPFGEGCSERHLVEQPPVHTGDRDRPALPARLDRLTEHMGPIRAQADRLLGPVVEGVHAGAVRFRSDDLFGPGEEPGFRVLVDLSESYLEEPD